MNSEHVFFHSIEVQSRGIINNHDGEGASEHGDENNDDDDGDVGGDGASDNYTDDDDDDDVDDVGDDDENDNDDDDDDEDGDDDDDGHGQDDDDGDVEAEVKVLQSRNGEVKVDFNSMPIDAAHICRSFWTQKQDNYSFADSSSRAMESHCRR